MSHGKPGDYLTMRGEMWDAWGHCDCLCVTTNANLSRRTGALVMGAGVAKEAAQRFPELPRVAGGLLSRQPQDYLFLTVSVTGGVLGLLQTKRDYWNPSPPELIERALDALVRATDNVGWRNVHLPLPGAGLGGLHPDAVHGLLASRLDARFTVWSRA